MILAMKFGNEHLESNKTMKVLENPYVSYISFK